MRSNRITCTSAASAEPELALADRLGWRRRSLLLAGVRAATAAPLLGGCAAWQPGQSAEPVDATEAPGFLPPPDGVRRPVALVLSGGAARGFAHLGALRVVEREGLRPDLVVGTSAGAMVGAMWASGMPVSEIERAAEQLDWTVFFDFDPVRTVLGGLGLGLGPGARLEQFLRPHLRGPIERFPLPFAAVAADMESGEVVPLNHGDAAKAVRASCAVPGVYAPVRARGRLLADGQIVSPLPVMTARRLGAMRVLALDVVYPPNHSEMSSPVSMLFQSLIVSGWRQVLAERALADLVITPEIRTSSQLGLGSRGWVTAAGETTALSRIGEIRRLFAPSP